MNIELIDWIHRQLDEEANKEDHNYILIAQLKEDECTTRAEVMPWFLKSSIVQLAKNLDERDILLVAMEIVGNMERKEVSDE